MTGPTCATCRYFLLSGDDAMCRRYPPTAVLQPATDGNAAGVFIVQRALTVWPGVEPGDWCGEWQEGRR